MVHTQVDLLLYSLLQDETCQRILSKAAGKGAFSSLMQQMVRGYEEHLRTLPSVTGATGQQKVAAPSLTAARRLSRTWAEGGGRVWRVAGCGGWRGGRRAAGGGGRGHEG